jgi:hypothetical protein
MVAEKVGEAKTIHPLKETFAGVLRDKRHPSYYIFMIMPGLDLRVGERWTKKKENEALKKLRNFLSELYAGKPLLDGRGRPQKKLDWNQEQKYLELLKRVLQGASYREIAQENLREENSGEENFYAQAREEKKVERDIDLAIKLITEYEDMSGEDVGAARIIIKLSPTTPPIEIDGDIVTNVWLHHERMISLREIPFKTRKATLFWIAEEGESWIHEAQGADLERRRETMYRQFVKKFPNVDRNRFLELFGLAQLYS